MVRRTLASRLGVPIFLLAIAGASAGLGVTARQATSLLRSEAEQRGLQHMLTLETVANVSDLAGLRRATTSTGAWPDVSLVIVAAGDPLTVLASSQTEMVGRLVDELPEELAMEINQVAGQDFMKKFDHRPDAHTIGIGGLFTRDATRDGTSLHNAVAYVDLDLGEVAAALSADQRRFQAAVLILTAALVGFVLLLLRRHVIGPLGAIADSVRNEDSPVADKMTSDEFHLLASKLHAALRAHAVAEAELDDANQKLRELVTSKDEFLASISHELRTPLSSIVGFANYLKDPTTELSDEERTAFVETISREGDDVLGLIEDLLTAARADIDRLDLKAVRVGLLAQANQVVEGLATRLGEVPVSGDTVMVIGDPRRVRQVVRNLLTNADRYGGERVEVRVGIAGGYGVLQVVDNGPGVPAAEAAQIFEPYERASGGRRSEDSVGIGLPLARTLAEGMGGALEYRHAGGECIFELRLPLHDRPNVPLTVVASASPTTS